MIPATPAAGTRLAIVVSHPIQYYAPWFRHLAQQPGLELRVFYLWDFGVTAQVDRGFGHALQWDLPLLDGYAHEFVTNRSKDPGTHRFRGLDNPELVPRLAKWKPDAILLFGYAYWSHLRVLLSPRLTKVPLLLRGDSHDLGRPRGARSTLSRWTRRLLFKRFARFLAVGKANTDYYRKAGVPAECIYFVPHCVDNDRFRDAAPQATLEASAWRRELGIPADALVVLFAGKFEPQKRPLDLLAAFSLARPSHGNHQGTGPVLLFVGSGELEAELRLRAGVEVGRSVFFVPFQNQRQMPNVYAMADLLVLPSQSESWGLAVNEAMSMGRVVIVSSHVGCGPDLVRSGVTGWIHEAGSVSDLGRLLSEAFAVGRTTLLEMGARAHASVSEYSYASATLGLCEALKSLSWPPKQATKD